MADAVKLLPESSGLFRFLKTLTLTTLGAIVLVGVLLNYALTALWAAWQLEVSAWLTLLLLGIGPILMLGIAKASGGLSARRLLDRAKIDGVEAAEPLAKLVTRLLPVMLGLAIDLIALFAVTLTLSGIGSKATLVTLVLLQGLISFLSGKMFIRAVGKRLEEIEPGDVLKEKGEDGSLKIIPEHAGVFRALGYYEDRTLSAGNVFVPFFGRIVTHPVRGEAFELLWEFNDVPTSSGGGHFYASVRIEGLLRPISISRLLASGGLSALKVLLNDDVEEAVRDAVAKLTPTEVNKTPGEEIAKRLRTAIEAEKANDADPSDPTTLLESFGVELAKLSVAKFQCSGFAEAKADAKKAEIEGKALRSKAKAILGVQNDEDFRKLDSSDRTTGLAAASGTLTENATTSRLEVGPGLSEVLEKILSPVAERMLAVHANKDKDKS